MTEPAGAPDRADLAGMREGTGSAELERDQVRGSSLLLLGRVAAMLLTVTTQVVLVRALSKSEFGAFAFALAVASACRVLLSLGQGKALSRHLALYDEQDDHGRLFGTVILTGITIVVMSLILVTGVLMLREPLGATFLDSVDAADVIVVLIFLAPLEAIDEVFLSLFAVFAKPKAIFFRRYLLTPALRLVTVAVVAATGASATYVAAGYVGTSALGIVLYGWLLRRVLRERGLLGKVHRRQLVLPYRVAFSFSLPLMSSELMYLSIETGSVAVLAYYANAAAVAEYRAVFPAARLNQLVFTVFATLYLPLAARLMTRGDIPRLRKRHWNTAMLLAVFSFPVCAMTVPFAPSTTVTLLGEQYADSAVIMAVLAFGYYVNICLGFNLVALQVTGRIRYLLVVNVFVALVNLGMGLLLVQDYGALGVAIANGAVLLLQNLLYQWAVRSELQTSFIAAGYRRGYLVIIAALLALIAVQLLFSPSTVAALLIAAVTSLLVLLATRHLLELDQSFPELLRVPLLRWLLTPKASSKVTTPTS